MTIMYPTAQERSHARANSFENPRLRARRTKEIIPVVTTPIESEKAIFRFSCVFMVGVQVPMLCGLVTSVRSGSPRSPRLCPGDRHGVAASLRQLPADLLRRHVLGVPVGPFHIANAGPLLVQAMRGFRTAHRGRQVGHRGERRLVSIHAPGQPRGDLLQQPGVAVRILERGV